MSFHPATQDLISSEEAEALARFVHDLGSRMDQVANLLQERGTPNTAMLAGTIRQDLHSLQELLNDTGRQPATAAVQSFLSTRQ